LCQNKGVSPLNAEGVSACRVEDMIHTVLLRAHKKPCYKVQVRLFKGEVGS